MTRAHMGLSPAIPTVASLLLAALWALSVFAGWGFAAFCESGDLVAECERRLGFAVTLSGVFAVVAAVCTAGAWLAFAIHRNLSRFNIGMGVAIAAWVVAEGVLFIGGMLVR
ncbi:hypothetical protein [Sinosporangium siamense]|uniref:hypothetical protein n=1 Tax=Sinosporangium siamense TaxID=1367973 RepID=UPI0019504FD9|nr:hypothetical protein [Sinosporangium siamense]